MPGYLLLWQDDHVAAASGGDLKASVLERYGIITDFLLLTCAHSAPTLQFFVLTSVTQMIVTKMTIAIAIMRPNIRDIDTECRRCMRRQTPLCAFLSASSSTYSGLCNIYRTNIVGLFLLLQTGTSFLLHPGCWFAIFFFFYVE